MSNRFEKLYSLSGQLYAPSSPVIITAGALLKDTQTGKVLAQLKFKNINSKVIKAITVSLLPRDTANQPLGEKETHQILDLAANRDSEFGQKTPLYFSDNTTRAYQVIVEEVVFSDNTVWKTDGTPLSELPAQKAASETLVDVELEKQYKSEYGERANYMADTCFDLWRCHCGAINRSDEQVCHICSAEKSSALSVSIVQLKKACQIRLEEERKEAEQASIQNNLLKRKARKKGGICAAALCAIVAGYYAATLLFIPTHQLKQSVSLLESGDYDAANKMLSEIRKADFLDSQVYKYGISFFDNGKYQQAIILFEKAGNYRDSQTYLANAKSEIIYIEAQSLIEAGNYGEAISLLNKISSYKDVDDLLQNCVDNLADNLYQSGNYAECIKLCEEEKVFPETYPAACYYYAKELQNNRNYLDAITYYNKSNGFADSEELIAKCRTYNDYEIAIHYMESGDLTTAAQCFKKLGNFESSQKLLSLCEANAKYIGYWKSNFYSIYDYRSGRTYSYSIDNEYEGRVQIRVNISRSGEVLFEIDGRDATKDGSILTCRESSRTTTFNLATGKRTVQYYSGINNDRKSDRYEYTHQMP